MSIEWVVGTTIGIIALISGAILRDRQVHETMKRGDELLHARVTKVQEEYVRRDDLYNHVRSIENNVGQMREEQRATNARIDVMLNTMTSAKK